VFGFSAWTQRVGLRSEARAWLGLPYYNARMTMELAGETVHYKSVRVHTGAAPAEFSAAYQPTGPVYRAASGTLDHWLT